MQVWIYNSDGVIEVFTTREKAMETFKEYLNYSCKTPEEREEAVNQMEELGYYYDEEIFPTEAIE